MPEQHVVVVDMGSSGLRAYAVPVERPWEVPPGAARAYPVRRRPGELRQSLSPAALRTRLLGVLHEAASAAQDGPGTVIALAVTAQRGGAAFLDAHGRTLYVGPNRDLRAVFEGAGMDERHGEEIHARTGHLPSMFFTPAKLRWWQTNRPRDARRIARLLTLGAWAVHTLTGEAAETAPSLAEAGLLDVCATPPQPPRGLLETLGVDPMLLPPIIESGTPTGTLTDGAAEATGLPRHTRVYLTGPDAQTALLGMGDTTAGNIGVAAGWSAPVQAVTDKPVFDPKRRTWTGRHLPADRWVLEANPSDTGGTVDAVRRLLRFSYARFDAAATRALAEHPVVALWGPRALDLSAPGMTLGGLLLPVPVTHEGLDAATIARATLENAAYAIRECVELVESLTGVSEQVVSLTGGMAAGAVFPRMLASALGKSVLLHHPLATATGAAIVASRRPDEWEGVAAGATAHARSLGPEAGAILEHSEGYERWKRLRARLDQMADEL